VVAGIVWRHPPQVKQGGSLFAKRQQGRTWRFLARCEGRDNALDSLIDTCTIADYGNNTSRQDNNIGSGEAIGGYSATHASINPRKQSANGKNPPAIAFDSPARAEENQGKTKAWAKI
jgi:hypothetical protein